MKKLTALILLCLCFVFAKADTFVVTSNADSGPGTLREAITMANVNGTSVADYIYFNIPQTSFNLRMINLVTELPGLSSNITIDGTTQPGNSYAITDAKICIRKDDYAPSFSLLKIENAQNVRIYGLYLYYGYWQGFFGTPWRSNLLFGINLINSNNIEIGAPGKGNVINGVVHGISSNSDSCRNVIIRSNYIGPGSYFTNPNDDIEQTVLSVESCITLAQVKDITIGGSNPEEGNVFGSSDRAINIDSRYPTGNGFLKIRNNIFARGFDKTKVVSVLDFWDPYIKIGRSRNNFVPWTSTHYIDYRVEVMDNDIPNHIGITWISDSIIVKRNKFEGDYRSNNGAGFKLGIGQCTGGGIIGGENASDGNVFRNKRYDDNYASLTIDASGHFTILKNVFECNTVFGSTTSIYQYNNSIPFAQIDVTTSNTVVGRATSGSKVDLYYDDPCTACEGLIYIASVVADASGNWIYNGPVHGTVVATATTSLGSTSEFSKPIFNTDSLKIKQPTCGKNNGSITGIKSEGAETYFWMRYNQTDTVGRSIDLLNAGPGMYLLYGVHGGTCINTLNMTITLEDVSPKIQTSSISIVQPSCGRFNGSISGLTVSYSQYSGFKWINNQGQKIGDQTDINSLGPGTYRFVVKDTTSSGGCSDTARFVLTNQSGPTLNTNAIRISSAICDNKNGSITGLSATGVTGSPFIRWEDSLNNIVGTDYDLRNIPAGKYRLKFKDAGACDTIITPYYVVGNSGNIIIDTVGKIILPSKCSGSTGSIQNLAITGGDTYQWKNTVNGAIMGNTAALYDLAPGNYQLMVSNSYGCSRMSPVIVVPQTKFITPVIQQVSVTPSTCEKQNGEINVSFLQNNSSYTFHWTDSTTGQSTGNNTHLANLYSGTYLLFAKDSNGCEQAITKAIVEALPIPSFDYSRMQITPEQCTLGQGTITGIAVKDLPAGTTHYLWLDANNNSTGNNIDVQNLHQGNYVLKATDVFGCTVISKPIEVNNLSLTLNNPQYDDQTILKNTAAKLVIKNFQAGTYQLFDDVQATTLLQQNTNGNFTTSALTTDKTYYIRYVSGSCASDLVAIKITVVDKTAIYVPDAFTPNGDGKNDVLKAIAYGKIKPIYFTVYNRWGAVVFSTSDFRIGWNGTISGQPAISGVYIWMVKAIDELSGHAMELKGTVTLFR